MASFRLVFLLLLCFCSAAFAELITSYCSDNTTIASAQMSANIDVVLRQLAKNTAKNDGFSIATYGQGKDTVYGLGQCRKDINSSACSTCIHDAASYIRQSCYYENNGTDERIYYDNCLLRYSDQKFFGIFDPSVVMNFYSSIKPRDQDFFRVQLETLMNFVISFAVMPQNKGFMKGSTAVSSSVDIYGIAQCTQDLSTSSCQTCLKTGFANFDKLCRKQKTVGCRVQYGGCYLRYDTDPF
ncbi:OLC1v1006635C1 [Oldenlandia corymbosa var. corymbosa]|uniref:OLC1v1006635C1 n=1 Tax=Oldenlandia corymbosa var. corymbosa TaxID=529605 RepID=A0AAV1DHG8_OLDCO|nr:OLC1v1006635C1 [Oldenlandia corymbosa var. corymbosa]